MIITDELNAKGATPETILQIMKNSVFEVSGDPSPDEMLATLRLAVGDPRDVDKALSVLRSAPDLIHEIALLWIDEASEDEGTREAIEGAVADADREMPLLEVGALTLIALYAIYKLAPRNPIRTKRKALKMLPDGRFEQVEVETEYDSFSEPVKGLLGIFSKRADDIKS